MAEEQSNFTPAFDIADEYRPEPLPEPEIPAWKNGTTRIGIHTSIAGDIVYALDTAYGLGANALQIFSSSPRMWARPQQGSRIPSADAVRFRNRRHALRLGPLVIHDNYLINLASPEPMLRVRSIQAFHDELVRAIELGADYLVTHPGSGRGTDMSQAVANIAGSLRQAVRGLKLNNLTILLENTAGQGSSVGSRFEELQAIRNACSDMPIGFCVDTAHLFEAGYDLRTEEGLDRSLHAIDRTIGLDNAPVFHANDSKTPLGSRVDRHEHIGKGRIGLEAFRRILNHPLLSGRAFILETPIDKLGDDRRNVRTLWKLIGVDVKQAPGVGEGFPRSRRTKSKKARRRAGKRRSGAAARSAARRKTKKSSARSSKKPRKHRKR
jgi:deoxyribonuclease-4